MPTIRRRGLLATGAAASLATAAPLAAPALAQGRTEWRMVTAWPKGFPGPGTAAERFAAAVGAATDGRLTIKVFGAGEIVPPFECFDAVTRGAADLFHGTPYYWINKSRALNFFATVPFGMTTTEAAAWMNFGGGQELWDEIYAGFGLKGFHGGSSGVQMGGWFNRELRSLADAAGLKMRMPGIGGDGLRRLGMTTVNIPAGEIFAALQSGAIDATEWTGPWNDLTFGLHKAARFYYWPGMHEPGAQTEITVDRAKLEGLPRDVQAIFRACAKAESEIFNAEFDRRNGGALETLLRTHGVQLRRFPNDFLQAWGNACGAILAEMREDPDPMLSRVTRSYLGARRELMAWNRIATQGFMNARLLDYRYG